MRRKANRQGPRGLIRGVPLQAEQCVGSTWVKKQLSSSMPFRTRLFPLLIILKSQFASPNGHLSFLSLQHTSHHLLVNASPFPKETCSSPSIGFPRECQPQNPTSRYRGVKWLIWFIIQSPGRGLAQRIVTWPSWANQILPCRNLKSEQTSQDRRESELGLTTVVWKKGSEMRRVTMASLPIP